MTYFLQVDEKMPSGRLSSSCVIGGPEGVMRVNHGGLMPYTELEGLFDSAPEPEIENRLRCALAQKLELRGEELKVVCERVVNEYCLAR